MAEESRPPRPAELPPPPRLLQYGGAEAPAPERSLLIPGQDQRWERERQHQLAQSIRLLQEKARLAASSPSRLGAAPPESSPQVVARAPAQRPAPAPAAWSQTVPAAANQTPPPTAQTAPLARYGSLPAVQAGAATGPATVPAGQSALRSEQTVAHGAGQPPAAVPSGGSAAALDQRAAAAEQAPGPPGQKTVPVKQTTARIQSARPAVQPVVPHGQSTLPSGRSPGVASLAAGSTGAGGGGALAARGAARPSGPEATPPAKRSTPSPERGAEPPLKRARSDGGDAPSPAHKGKKTWLSRLAGGDASSDSAEDGAPTAATEDAEPPSDASPPSDTEAKPTPNGAGENGASAGPAATNGDKKKKRGRPRKLRPADEPHEKRLPVVVLKKTGQSFLQDRFCCKITSKLPKCRECRAVVPLGGRKASGIYCRFTDFRRVRYTRNGQLAEAGFCDPVRDASGASDRLWRAALDGRPGGMEPEVAKFLLAHVANQFCDLVGEEEAARRCHLGDSGTVAWKRVVQGCREMCDVCETTLFNVHWVCDRCGFAVCVDCYRSRADGTAKVWGEPVPERDEFRWLLCGVRKHEQSRLLLTQIVAGDALTQLNRQVHEARLVAGLPLSCQCEEARRLQAERGDGDRGQAEPAGQGQTLGGGQVKIEDGGQIKTEGGGQVKTETGVQVKTEGGGQVKAETGGDVKIEGGGQVKSEGGGRVETEGGDTSTSRVEKDPVGSRLDRPASAFVLDSMTNSDDANSDSDSDDDAGGGASALRKLLVTGISGADEPSLRPPAKKERPRRSGWSMEDMLDEVLDKVSARASSAAAGAGPTAAGAPELRHFVRRCASKRGLRERLPIRIMTLSESTRLYPDVRHSWLCDGKLLRLHDTASPEGVRLFRDQWKRGQPVLCSGIGGGLNRDIWSVDAFIRDFGDVRNDLINCKTGNIVPNQPMRRFWEGFECVAKRLRDDAGQPMVLKLKDWPPGEDFADMMPARFNDLMSVLPMTDYTRRDGRLNLASCLPDCFVRPDLGPKMYIAYGCALHPSKASTNLHLDVSDAVNIMVHVGIPPDGDADNAEALRAIDEAGCDQLTKRRVEDELPGALWHIYHAADADKIRDLLNKIAIERGDQLEPHHDPIHDQSWYLDNRLRRRLYEEYGVEGYPIVQCAGDAVFIPAGAPHQVRNLHSCIKVAEDFVSPENVGHCFDLTQEFRSLSDTHTNHEDKLQIKNIIFHAMKDAVSCLLGGERSPA